MKFKAGETREGKTTAVEPSKGSGVFMQSQTDANAPMRPSFGLAWRLDYDDGHTYQSEWTPDLQPSIRRSLAARPDVATLTVLGQHNHGGFSLELARFDYSLVKGFGYIAEQSYGKPVEAILGLHVDLKDGRTVKIWRNGFVQEVSQ